MVSAASIILLSVTAVYSTPIRPPPIPHKPIALKGAAVPKPAPAGDSKLTQVITDFAVPAVAALAMPAWWAGKAVYQAANGEKVTRDVEDPVVFARDEEEFSVIFARRLEARNKMPPPRPIKPFALTGHPVHPPAAPAPPVKLVDTKVGGIIKKIALPVTAALALPGVYLAKAIYQTENGNNVTRRSVLSEAMENVLARSEDDAEMMLRQIEDEDVLAREVSVDELN